MPARIMGRECFLHIDTNNIPKLATASVIQTQTISSSDTVKRIVCIDHGIIKLRLFLQTTCVLNISVYAFGA